MKKLFILSLVLLLVIGILSGCGTTTTELVTGKSADFTKEMFDKMENGMTFEQVQEIIGDIELEVMSEVGEKGTDMYTVVYMTYGKGQTGANANFTFQGNPLKLVTKAQMGLK